MVLQGMRTRPWNTPFKRADQSTGISTPKMEHYIRLCSIQILSVALYIKQIHMAKYIKKQRSLSQIDIYNMYSNTISCDSNGYDKNITIKILSLRKAELKLSSPKCCKKYSSNHSSHRVFNALQQPRFATSIIDIIIV